MAENILAQDHSHLTSAIGDLGDPLTNNVYDGSDMSSYATRATSETNYSVTSTSMLKKDPDYAQKKKACVKIIEQPQPKALRFRYVCEGRSAGAIPGVSSTAENKTHPKIKILNFKGPVSVVVSCVTVEPPYRPHPHKLVGKECNKGVCTIEFENESMEYEFTNLGVQCIKKKDVEEALRQRQEIKVDPFMTGFNHAAQPQQIDFNAVRLCFQVYLRDPNNRSSIFPVKPIVSEPIYDKKATADLIICKLSDCTGYVTGGKEIILLCDKVNKEDIKVRFYEVRMGGVYWEAYADFQPSDVHKQVAISFKTPRYENLDIENPVKVYIQLFRPSDETRSEPRQFEYLPLDSDCHGSKRKRVMETAINSKFCYKIMKENTVCGSGADAVGSVPRPIIHPNRVSRLSGENSVKLEPRDAALSLSPDSPDIGPHPKLIRAPVSSHHYAGGGMYEVAPAVSETPSVPFYEKSSIPIEVHVSPNGSFYAGSPNNVQPQYLVATQPGNGEQQLLEILPPSLTTPSPYEHILLASPMARPAHPHHGVVYQSPSPQTVQRDPSPSADPGGGDPILGGTNMGAAGTTLTYTNLDTMKVEGKEMPEMSVDSISGLMQIPSGDLVRFSQPFSEMIDIHLSDNLSNMKVNLGDDDQINQLDQNTVASSHGQEQASAGYNYNIPPAGQLQNGPAALSGCSPAFFADSKAEDQPSSDSMKKLVSDLRFLKKAAADKN